MKTPLKVLYVDDEPELLEIGKIFLERGGDYSVTTCEGAGEAMKRISGEAFDVIVSDYMMPECDGIRFLKYLRKHGEETPFIIFTGKGREEVVIEAFENGADFYIQKGGDPRAQFAELRKKIEYAASRRRSERALRESEAYYRTIFANTGTASAILEEDTTISLVNDEFANLCGYSHAEIEGKMSWTDFVGDRDRQKMLEQHKLRRSDRLGAKRRYEFGFVRKDGEIRDILLSIDIIPGTKKSIASLLDITDRKRAEVVIQENEERYRALFDQSSDGIYLHDLDGSILDVNEAAVAQSGYSRDELLRMTIFDLHHDSGDRDDILRQWHGWQPGQPLTVETVHRRRDGTVFPGEVRTGVVRIRDRDYILAILRDITDRRQAEETLNESQKLYRMITDNMTETISVMDLSQKFTYVSPSIKALRGFSVEDAMQQSLEDVLTPESRSRALTVLEEEFRRERDGSADPNRSISLDLEEYKSDNSTVWVNNTLKFLRDHEGRPASILIVSRDITDRKEAEEAVRESEEKFRTIFANSPYPIAINSDPGFTFLEVNKAFLDVSGYSEEEIIGRDPVGMGLLPLPQVMKLLSRRLITGKLENVPLALTAKDGKRVHVLFSTIPVTINKKPAMVTVTAEVTKLKRVEEEILRKNEELNAAIEELAATEEELRSNYEELSRSDAALRESEEKFRALVEHSLDGILITDFSGNLLFTNRSAGDIIEASDYRKLIGKVNVLDFVAPESRADVIRDFDNVSRGNDAYLVNYKIITEKNHERWVECIGSRVSFGNATAILVSMRDVTERMVGEEKLRESENKFFSAFRNSPLAITLVSATDGSFVEVNDTFVENTGYTRDEIIGRTADDLSIFVDRGEYEEFVTLLRQQKTVHAKELRCRQKTGAIRTCLFTSAIIIAGGKPQILTTIQDVTDRKVAEDAHQVMVRRIVGETGLSSLHTITENISSWLDASCVMIGEIQPDGQTVRTLSMILDGEERSGFSYALEESPCGNVVRKGFCLYSDDAATQFPENRFISDHAINGYMGTPLLGSAGEPIGILCVMSKNPLPFSRTMQDYLDLIAMKVATEVERLRIERELRESRRLLAEAMYLADLVAWECDVPSEMFTFDDRFYALYGTSAAREGGTRMSAERYARDFVHPDDQHLIAKEMEKARKTGDPGFVSQLEHRIIRRDGEVRTIMVRFGVTKDEYGRTIKTHGANQDITERKRAEEALRQSNRKLNLLSSITRHDILNQIMVVKGYLDFAEELSEDQVQAKYLETVKKAISTIQRQITFTREYEQLGVDEPVWLPIERLVRKAADSAIPVNCDCPGISVYADPMLEKVFSNLMDNTLRYAEGATGVQVRCIPEGSGLVITWEDDGPGIPDEEKELIFSRGVGKNTGLGLFLTREILGITGISIRETGEPGRGARFEMTVPEGVYRSESGDPEAPG